MKYFFIPIWRVIVALFVLLNQIMVSTAWMVLFLWELKIPAFDRTDFYYAIDDREMIFMQSAISGLTPPPDRYYRDPWDALIGKITYIPHDDKD